MQRPRRTTEYETPSGAARQSRTSRLQQPIRRPSIREGSLTRSSSAEPINSLAVGPSSHLSVPTSTKRQRSSSVSNARTPQRIQAYITPSKASQFTGEKQRAVINDKRWIQEQVDRITEYLKTVDCGIKTDFLHRDGLKTMSMKQFIGIVDYFLKFIAGNKFKIGANHVESITKILNQIEYPYTVTKSWLKTPTAPHAFGNAVMLFSFFMDFIPPADNIDVFKKTYLIASEEFPDMDFAFKLSNMAEEGFSLWNNQKNEEFETLQKTALDELISIKLNIPSSDALDVEIERLNAKLDAVSSQKAHIQDEDEYYRLDKEVKTNQRKIEKIQNQMLENQNVIDQLKVQIKCQRDLIDKNEISVEEILNVVNKQETSVEERNKLIEEVAQLQYVLQTKEQAVCDLQEQDNQSQIQLSRKIKQLTEAIAHFNSYIRQIMIDFKDLGVDIESLCLHQNIELDKNVAEATGFLKKLQRHIATRIEDLSKGIDTFEQQIKLITYEISSWMEPKLQETAQQIKETQQLVDELDREIIGVKNLTTNRLQELHQKAKHYDDVGETLRIAIDKNQQEIPKTQAENEAMMKLVGERFDEYFTTKDALLRQFQESLQKLQKKCTEAETLIQ